MGERRQDIDSRVIVEGTQVIGRLIAGPKLKGSFSGLSLTETRE